MGLALVVGLHVLFVYALIAGIGIKSPLQKESRIDARVIDEPQRPPDDLPPMPSDPTQIIQVDTVLPVPRITIDDAVTTVVDPQPATPTDLGSGTAETTPAWISARVDPRHPLSQPPYPAIETRAGHEGTLTLALLISVDGRVADAKVTKSSGFPLLDQAAVNEAKRRWRLLPATRGGSAVEDWTMLRVVFRLDELQR